MVSSLDYRSQIGFIFQDNITLAVEVATRAAELLVFNLYLKAHMKKIRAGDSLDKISDIFLSDRNYIEKYRCGIVLCSQTT